MLSEESESKKQIWNWKLMKYLWFVVYFVFIKLERFMISIDYNRDWVNFSYSNLKSSFIFCFNVNVV